MPTLQRRQIAGMNIHYLYYSLDYFLNAQADLGVETIELWGGMPHFWLDHSSIGDCSAMRRKLTERGLSLAVFTPENCIYPYQVAACEADHRAKSKAYFANGIRAAAELGCRIMEINSGWGNRDEPREEAWQRSADMLRSLAEIAGKEGIKLAIESLRPEESNLVTDIPSMRALLAQVDHPALKPMIDTCAMGVAGETLDGWFDAFGEDIIHIHFVDGTPYGHLVWGDGDRPMAAYVQSLNDHGYQGFLGQEITDGRYLDDPREADRRNMQHYLPFIA